MSLSLPGVRPCSWPCVHGAARNPRSISKKLALAGCLMKAGLHVYPAVRKANDKQRLALLETGLCKRAKLA